MFTCAFKDVYDSNKSFLKLTEVQNTSVTMEEKEYGAEPASSSSLSMKRDHSKSLPANLRNEPEPSDTQ